MSNSKIEVFDSSETQKRLQQKRHDKSDSYLAMYSSWLGGITTDPAFMTVPVDDHIVHRGDGVFEAFRIVNSKPYDMEPHLRRLAKSAEMVSLPLSHSLTDIANICVKTFEVTNQTEAMVRLYLSRGPGSFTPNPYDSVGSQLYIVITAYKPVDESRYKEGCTAITSKFQTKPGFFSRVKSCNYLPNVLTKKESVDAGADFSINITPEGYIAEGPTENIAMISNDNYFVAPPFDYILEGITLTKVMSLAETLVANGTLRGVKQQHISKDDLLSAKECFITGTTLEVLPLVQFDGKPIADGKVGAISTRLRALLKQDMSSV